MMGLTFCKTQNLLEFDKKLPFIWKFSIWEYMSLNTLETDLEIHFAENNLDAMMKCAPVEIQDILAT